MKRTALVLAAAVLGTGCIVTDDDVVDHCDSVMTLEWEFQDYDGAIRGCTAAQRPPVDSVDVWVDGVYQDSFWCSEGAGSIWISSAASLVTVEGISGGRIAYRHEFAPNRSCADQLVLVRPAQGTVRVDYAFAPTNACHTPPTYIALSVRDDIVGAPAFVETAATGPLCSVTDFAPEWTLPVGSFTLEWIEEVTAAGGVLAADCNDRSFPVDPAAATEIEPTLVDATVACL